jgi:hypothetical protein
MVEKFPGLTMFNRYEEYRSKITKGGFISYLLHDGRSGNITNPKILQEFWTRLAIARLQESDFTK